VLRTKTARLAQRAGFSLIELMIVITLLGTVVGSVLAVLRTTTRAIGVGTTDARLESLASQTLDLIATRLRASQRATMTPTLSAPFSSSQITFQSSVGIAAGVTLWGPVERIGFEYSASDPNDGIDNDGNGLVDEGRVVWVQDVGGPNERSTVWANGVSEYLHGETRDNTDQNGNGLVDEQGLCFDFDGTSVIVRLTLAARDASGVTLTRTVQERVFFRNR
jgi:prepilin-type N-terminal cleavage/methylation domain-containing protein